MSELRPGSVPPPRPEGNDTPAGIALVEPVADQVDDALRPYEGLFYDSPDGTDPAALGSQVRQVLEHDAPTTYHGPGDSGRAPAEAASTTPTTEAARQRDIETRHSTIDLLGNSYRFTRLVNDTGIQSAKHFKLGVARIRNTFALPNKAIKQFAVDRAKSSYGRVEARLKEAEARGAGGRIMRRRQNAVDKAADRLIVKEQALGDHKKAMTERISTVKDTAEVRKQRYIGELKQRRIEAVGRKTVRRELRTQSGSFREARSIFAEIPKEQLDRVGAVVLNHEASRRKTTKAEHHRRKTERSLDKTLKNMADSKTSVAGHESDQAWSTFIAGTIASTTLPKIEGRIHTLEERLQHIRPHSPGRQYAEQALRDAKREHREYSTQLRKHQKAATHSGNAAASTQTRYNNLGYTRVSRQLDYAEASRQRYERAQAEQEDRRALADELENVLSSKETKGKS